MTDPAPQDLDGELLDAMVYYNDKPDEWVQDLFPWGEPGSPLAEVSGPRVWQLEVLREIREHVAENPFDGKNATVPYRLSVVSGHGTGKSALTAMLTLWIMSTRPFS